VLAKIKSLQGKRDEALRVVKQAIELNPEIGDSHFYYALLAFEAGRPAEAFRALDTAAQLGRKPRTAAELRVVGNHYGDAGDYTRAIALYEEGLRLDGGDLEAQLKLGLVYYYHGDIGAARRYIQGVALATDLREATSYPLLKPIFDELGIVLQGSVSGEKP
jgi:tetratricopeptide (TPR) repeat protein